MNEKIQSIIISNVDNTHEKTPFVNLDSIYIAPEAVNLIPYSLAKKHRMLPFKIENNLLYIAMEDPLNFIAIDDVTRATNMNVFPILAEKVDIESTMDRIYGKDIARKAIEDFKKENIQHNRLKEGANSKVNSAPIVRLVTHLLSQAVKDRASDIHFEPMGDEVRVRFRIDGVLRSVLNIPNSVYLAVVTRIKILGAINIAEKRLPQDGRFETVVDGRNIDIRVSLLPTIFGEKSVLRMLDRSSFLVLKDNLGLTMENMLKFQQLLSCPHGIILVTGPTGSGKTTTLYSILNEVNMERDNIITIEDPVEYIIPGINQVHVNTKAGLNFATGLRAILRQDPDVIMIGEIRDSETAQIAIRAAITGHLVLSTLHTNDAVSTLSRLLDMDIPSYLIAASLVGIVSQRLVRKVCYNCRRPYTPSRYELDAVGLNGDTTAFYMGEGCPICKGTGYIGRTAVHEILVINRKHREMICKGAHIEHIRQYSIKNGMSTLQQEARRTISSGITTFQEAMKIAYSIDE